MEIKTICSEYHLNPKKMSKIKHVLNTIVQVEPVNQQGLVPQCRNCQSF